MASCLCILRWSAPPKIPFSIYDVAKAQPFWCAIRRSYLERALRSNQVGSTPPIDTILSILALPIMFRIHFALIPAASLYVHSSMYK